MGMYFFKLSMNIDVSFSIYLTCVLSLCRVTIIKSFINFDTIFISKDGLSLKITNTYVSVLHSNKEI